MRYITRNQEAWFDYYNWPSPGISFHGPNTPSKEVKRLTKRLLSWYAVQLLGMVPVSMQLAGQGVNCDWNPLIVGFFASARRSADGKGPNVLVAVTVWIDKLPNIALWESLKVALAPLQKSEIMAKKLASACHCWSRILSSWEWLWAKLKKQSKYYGLQ